MLKIGMCDDDLASMKITAKFLEAEIIEQELDAEISIITTNQKDIFNAIYNNELDVLFLDIDFKCKGKNGLEFANDLRNVNKNFYLVFLSAHFKYIQMSLENKVFDFLVKPINRDTIESLVLRLKDEFSKNSVIFLQLNKWSCVRTDTITYIEKCDNKCKVYANNKTLFTTKTLSTLIDELPSNFVKCHKSYICNTSKILGIDKKQGLLYFSNDVTCPISQNFDIRGGRIYE